MPPSAFGFYFHPDSQKWMPIPAGIRPERVISQRALQLSETRGERHFLRKALYGNQWILRDEDTWEALTVATFSHDPTGREHRLDRFMVWNKAAFPESRRLCGGIHPCGTRFERPGKGKPPAWP